MTSLYKKKNSAHNLWVKCIYGEAQQGSSVPWAVRQCQLLCCWWHSTAVAELGTSCSSSYFCIPSHKGGTWGCCLCWSPLLPFLQSCYCVYMGKSRLRQGGMQPDPLQLCRMCTELSWIQQQGKRGGRVAVALVSWTLELCESWRSMSTCQSAGDLRSRGTCTALVGAVLTHCFAQRAHCVYATQPKLTVASLLHTARSAPGCLWGDLSGKLGLRLWRYLITLAC